MALAKTKSVSLGRPIHIYEGTLDLSAIPWVPLLWKNRM